MKRLLLSLPFVVWLSASPSMASELDTQTQLDLEAMALVQLIHTPESEILDQDTPRGLGDVIGDAWKKLQELKQQLLDQFDTNKNGRIDPGPELDNFKETVKSIILLLADSNQNGHIDAEDIKELTLFYLKQAEEKAKAKFCPKIIEEAEKAGDSLKYRPILKHLYQECLPPQPE